MNWTDEIGQKIKGMIKDAVDDMEGE